MSTRAVLDSSPVAIPPARPLKRSASIASLPTPPRTRHKRSSTSRSRSRGSASHTDSDSDSDSHGGSQGGKIVLGAKKRRTSQVLSGHDEEEDSENEFWTGRASKSEPKDSKTRSPSPALLQYRVKAPVSPPPSHRQTKITVAPKAPVELVTPPRSRASSSAVKTKAGKIGPERDSPNNPFLDDSPASPAGPRTPTQNEEKPTITYVFRGMKASFTNPFYNLSPTAHERSLLPVDHPDFSPNEACPPKLLFPPRLRHKSRGRSPSPVDSDDDDEDIARSIVPKKLTFAEEMDKVDKDVKESKVRIVRRTVSPVLRSTDSDHKHIPSRPVTPKKELDDKPEAKETVRKTGGSTRPNKRL